eukprot:15459196-Alexandrium_andersonii.AAC.1
MAAQRAREGRALPRHVARRAVVNLEAERPATRKRALLAAEAAKTASDERVELDDADFANFDLDGGLGRRSQEGWSASAGGAPW